MELFVSDEEFKRLETRLAQQVSLTTLVELAWHCRQRDTRRALQLAAQATKLLRQAKQPQRALAAARLRLIQAESNWLFTHLGAAHTIAQRALQRFGRYQDLIGQADATWVLGRILYELGYILEVEAQLQHARELAEQANDSTRALFFHADCASFFAFRQISSAKQAFEAPMRTALSDAPLVNHSIIHFFLGVVATLGAEFGTALPHFMQAYESALQCGQFRIAIISASNIVNALCELCDHQSALDWGQRSLELAQASGWPSSIATCMRQTAQPMRQLKQFGAAKQLLEQALVSLKTLPPFRSTAVTLLYLGELTYDQEDFTQAQSYFEQTWVLAEQLNQGDLKLFAQRNLAKTLSRQNQAQAALDMAQLALANAKEQKTVLEQIKMYQVLAEIHTRHKLASDLAKPALYYLQQARSLVAEIQGFTAPMELLEALSQAFAHDGQFEPAFRTALEAIAAREKSHNHEATNRAVAMQVRLQTERTLAEGEYHRQLAASEAERAQLLQQTSDTLIHLSAIGQELTTQLQQDAVLEIINQHVHQLLDVTSFEVYLLTPDETGLQAVFAIEAGQPLPLIRIALTDPNANSVRALQERREILLDVDPALPHQSQIPGTLQPASALFAPLLIGERNMGVMTVQSLRRHAYGERERLIFRTLCAYSAIALANAQANLRLQENALQLELAKQKAEQATHLKSAFLANMSHEIRTPMNAVIGLAHLALHSGLNPKQHNYIHKIHSSGLSLLGIVNDILDLSKIEAGHLDIETIAFDLDEVLQRVADVCSHAAFEKKLTLEFQVPAELPRHYLGDPLRLGQVLINLVNNAIKFCPQGQVDICCHPVDLAQAGSGLCFAVRDTGIGISTEQRERLFQAFQQAETSTSRKYGGTGLGLSISQQLVQLMGGHIEVTSEPGLGSCFQFSLPLPTVSTQYTTLPSSLGSAPELADGPVTFASGQYRILLAEDNEINQEIAVELLSQMGIEVDVATNGLEALQRLRQAKPDTYQLIFMDLEMPEMDGHEATQLIRQDARFATIPIIAMSAHVLLETQQKCHEDGMQDYIAKPIHPELIQTILLRWLAPGSN